MDYVRIAMNDFFEDVDLANVIAGILSMVFLAFEFVGADCLVGLFLTAIYFYCFRKK